MEIFNLILTFKIMIMTDLEKLHTQLSGMAYFDIKPIRTFQFKPDDPIPNITECYRRQGVAQQMRDGTFEFVEKPALKAQSVPIKKLAHGRVSKTKDGAIQLTLKVFCHEGINIGNALLAEALEAKLAVTEYQLKR